MADRSLKASLVGRSIVALVLFAGFYVLAFALAALLLIVPYVGVKSNIQNYYILVIDIACISAAGLIIWSILPRPERFKAPGLLLTPASEPRLFEEIFRLARASGQKAPREAYLVLEVTAWVSERGGFMGFGRRRIVGVGLALLECLSVYEFRAVLAHEYAHFRRGDTRLGPLISKTRNTIGRTIENLPVLSGLGKTAAAVSSLVQRPFVLYGNWYMRITQAVSRRQEFLADELAAESAGRETAASALRATFTADMSFRMYWENQLVQALSMGFLPPVAAGLGEYACFPPHREMVREALSWHVDNVRSAPHDSHPSLGERLKALEALPAGPPPESAPPAVTLLTDVPARERALFAFINPEAGPKLEPITWDEATSAVLIPCWAGLAGFHRADLAGITPGNLPDKLPELADRGRRMCLASGQTLIEEQAEKQSRGYAAAVVGTAITTKMVEIGWKAEAGPGRYTTLSLGEKSWEPFKCVRAFAGGELSVEEWLRACDDLGIGELDLGAGGPDENAGPDGEPVRPAEEASKAPPRPEAPPRRISILGIGVIGIGLALLIIQIARIGEGPAVPPDPAVSRFAAPSGLPADADRATAHGQRPSQAAAGFSLAVQAPRLVARVVGTSSRARSYGATVEVVNESSKTYNFIIVRVEFCDHLGRVIKTLMTDARRDDYLAPGGRKSFTVTGKGDLMFATVRAAIAYSAEAK